MYDNRYPNLRRIEESLDSVMLRKVRDVCRRATVEAAWCSQSSTVFFHLPGHAELGIWREPVFKDWTDGKVDQLSGMLNARKMPMREKLAEIACAEAAHEHEQREKQGEAMETFVKESEKVMAFRKETRGMRKGYRKTMGMDVKAKAGTVLPTKESA